MNEGFLRSQEIGKGIAPDVAERRIGPVVTALRQFYTVRYPSGTENGTFKMDLRAS